jgi:hypothetical protein
MKTRLWISRLTGLALAMSIASSAFAGLVTLTNSTSGLFDGTSGTRVVTFTGSEAGFESGVITDVNVSINFAKADGESFNPPFPAGTPFLNEIHFHLSSPNATTVHLIEAGSFNNGASLFDGAITFDDEAANAVNANPNQLTAGAFRPTGPGALSAFDGSSALGTWTLFIQDIQALDALRFRSFALEITTAPVRAQVPEPGTAILFAFALVALTVARTRAGRFIRRSERPVKTTKLLPLP